MAQKTIPQLQEGTEVDSNSLLVFDSGVQTYKITALNLAQGLRHLSTPPVIGEQSGNYSPTVVQEGGVIPLNSEGGSFNVQLPDPATMTGKQFTLKDVAGFLSMFPVTLVRNGAELIEGLAEDYELRADFGAWCLYCDGVDWIFI